MVDSLGWRMKFAVLAPSPNTSVQPEFDRMRPRGVTNHYCRTDDKSFMDMMENIRRTTMASVDEAMTMGPGHIIMGMSAETFWDGAAGANRLREKMIARSGGISVTIGSQAVDAALKSYGAIRRIGVLTPYMPVADAQVRRFFEEMGYEVVKLIGLRSPSGLLISHEPAQKLKRAVQELDDPGIEAIVQCGTNLAFTEVARIAEFWLEKPVIAINAATYWHALRTNGIADRIDGFGSLLLDH
jgi:maleate isomerase